jgi:glycosyltransferase involved in cell wall biosynthesis
MKIVHLVPYFHPGLGYEENHLAFAQAELGLDMTLISSTIPAPGFESEVPNGAFESGEEDSAGVRIVRLSPGLQLRNSSQIHLKGLKSAIASQSPDLIHIHNPVGILSLQGLWAARNLNIPIVLDSHINYQNLGGYGVVRRLYYRLFRQIFLPYFKSQIKVFLPGTPDIEMVLKSELGIEPNKITQVPLGTDSKSFAFDLSARCYVRKRLQIQPETQLIVFVGRIVPIKGVDVLLRGMASIPSSTDVSVVIAGPIDSAYKDYLESIATELGQKNRVSFIGPWPHDELVGLYSAADIGCWPGDGSVSILDALSCSLPAVIMRSEVTRHLLATGGALAFEPGNPAALASVLSKLINNREQLTALRENARAQIDSGFRWDQIAMRTKKIYEAVLAGQIPDLPAMWESRT